MDVKRVKGFGISDRGWYLLQTEDGSIIRFSNDGVDGSDFAGWPDYSFEDYGLSISYDCGVVNLEAAQGNRRVTIPLGRMRWCNQLRLWMHAVNARLPRRW